MVSGDDFQQRAAQRKAAALDAHRATAAATRASSERRREPSEGSRRREPSGEGSKRRSSSRTGSGSHPVSRESLRPPRAPDGAPRQSSPTEDPLERSFSGRATEDPLAIHGRSPMRSPMRSPVGESPDLLLIDVPSEKSAFRPAPRDLAASAPTVLSVPSAPPAPPAPPLQGVPDALRQWWARADATELASASDSSGRMIVLQGLAKRLQRAGSVLDLGCGPGLLAKEARRRDIVGVDMSAQMVEAAGAHMDEVLQRNFLDYCPSARFDAVVLCNCLDAYPADIWHLMFRHCLDFLAPSGRLYVVAAQNRGGALDCALDFVFPTAVGNGASGGVALGPAEIEEGLLVAGFDLADTELYEASFASRPSSAASSASGTVRVPRRPFALVSGQRPASDVD